MELWTTTKSSSTKGEAKKKKRIYSTRKKRQTIFCFFFFFLVTFKSNKVGSKKKKKNSCRPSTTLFWLEKKLKETQKWRGRKLQKTKLLVQIFFHCCTTPLISEHLLLFTRLFFSLPKFKFYGLSIWFDSFISTYCLLNNSNVCF